MKQIAKNEEKTSLLNVPDGGKALAAHSYAHSIGKCCCVLCSVYEYELPTLGEGPCAKLPQTCFSGICACYKVASCRGGGWHLLAVVPAVLCRHWGQTHQRKAPLGLPPSWSCGGGLARIGQVAIKEVVVQSCCRWTCLPKTVLCVLPAKPASFRNFAQHEERGGGDFQTA